MIKITVPAIPPSNNQFMGNSHSFRVYAEIKQEWHWRIKAAIREKPKNPYARAVVKITYFFKTKVRHDPDNYSGKMILDPLVKEGILKDDSFQNVILQLEGFVDKNNPRTEIEILEVEHAN